MPPDMWTIVGLTLVAGAGAISLLLALFVLWASPRRPVNLALAAFLALSGAHIVAMRLWALVPGIDWKYTLLVFGSGTYVTSYLVYLLFVGLALETPLVRPLRSRPVQAALGLGALGLLAAVFLWPDPLVASFTPTAAGHVSDFRLGILESRIAPFAVPALLAFTFGAAVHAYARTAPGSLARRRARGYLLAFGIQDLGMGASALIFLLPVETTAYQAVGVFVMPLALALGFAALAFAMLRWQLFDVELRLKRGLRHSTLAGAFVAVFFATSESAAVFFGDTTGSTYLGIAAAAALVFALAPLQRLAEGVANAAMPQVQATPAYLQFKRLEVYRSAVESALETGGIDRRERATLERLREKLGIAPEDAAALEADAAGTTTSPPGSTQSEHRPA